MAGLVSKVWLANAATNTYGGVYTWRDRAALERYRASGIYARLVSNPGLVDVGDREFGILLEPTRVTAPAVISAA